MKSRKHISIDVNYSPSLIDEMSLKDKNLVVIDVLRASTTVAAALHNGAKEIIPVNSIDGVVKISSSLFGGVTLRAGERNGKMIAGFNLGNSPIEYTEELVKGKSIILLTTNGSVTMVKGRYAKNLVIAGFVNLSAVVDFLFELKSDVVILCAGKENHFCMEDAVCAGRIINHLQAKFDTELVLNDAAAASTILDKEHGKNILRMLKNTDHGKYLTEIGFADDLKACAIIDAFPVLPMLSGNVIRAAKSNNSHSS